jgi:hypothetical protein
MLGDLDNKNSFESEVAMRQLGDLRIVKTS